MHPRIIHNGRLLEAAAARLPALTAAVIHGRGVFTVVSFHGGRAFLWPQHWARLGAHAERADVRLPEFDAATVERDLARLIEANNVERGLARVMLLARVTRGVWRVPATGDEPTETDLLIATADAPPVSDDG
ncbi:MAG TPA: aminotransferase class IV, partial [Pyrinomonadaceae bacterium]|nr:aminotransferase class IV [Pyrinomonadaceae bacterium]